jgi:DNA primase
MSQVQQVKDATDIVQVIGERIKLKRSGSSYKGLCPFHSEKSPSFFVSDQLQRYRCFGCGETGDVLDFLQKYDGMSFAESLQYLADRSGIKLKQFQRTPEDDLRQKLLEILSLAKEYYHYLLTDHQVGKKARSYLKDRKIGQDAIELFQLGYSQSGWDGLIKYLHKKKKHSLEDLEKAGLVIRGKGGRYYDRFRGRVMFPLKDHRGRVVGFSGRLLEKEAKEAKYINSPETLLYHKSKMLYGYKEHFAEIKKKEAVIVVEGEFDVISSSQAHVNHIVAIKGSALTQDQVKLLSRAANKIILSLDADEAGAEATRRAIEVVGDADIELRVIDLSAVSEGKKDVDEIARGNPKQWRELSDKTLSVYEFLLRLSLRHHDPETPEGKREIVKEVGLVFGQIPHAVERDFYVKKLAKKLQVQSGVILQDIQRLQRTTGQQSRSRRNDNKDEDQQEKITLPRREKLERYALFLLLENEDFSKNLEQLQQINLQASGFAKIIDHFAGKKLPGKPNIKSLSAGLGEDLKDSLFTVLHAPDLLNLKETINPDKEWQQTIKALKKDSTRVDINELQQQIAKLEKKSKRTKAEEQQLAKLLRQVVKLQQQLR